MAKTPVANPDEESEEMEELQPKPQKPKKRPRPPQDHDEREEWQPQQNPRPKPPRLQVLEPPVPMTSRQAQWRNQNWPAWGHLIAAGVALTVWFAGTSVQVETSEAWIASALTKTQISATIAEHFSVFGQIGAFWAGGLDHYQVVSYLFAWGTQAALILFSIGVDLPAHTKGYKARSQVFIWTCILLIALNSLGDWFYSGDFGFWGQCGFVLALFVTTFCFGYVAIHQIHRAIRCFQGKP
jgi:hypothetical protein